MMSAVLHAHALTQPLLTPDLIVLMLQLQSTLAVHDVKHQSGALVPMCL